MTLSGVPVSEPRAHLAQVTIESRDGWRAFTRRFGTNPTALVEVMGLRLGEMGDDVPAWLRECAEAAAELADARRQRS